MTAQLDKPRVLVVDDNHDAATTLSFLLESAGYEVETCFDGVHALAAAATFAPDACVLDINMPGMNGYELAKRLRDRDPEHAPVFATVTAYEDYSHLEKSVEAGFDLHFTKPADYLEVAAQLADSIRKTHPKVMPAAEIDVDTDEIPALSVTTSTPLSEPKPLTTGSNTASRRAFFLTIGAATVAILVMLGRVIK